MSGQDKEDLVQAICDELGRPMIPLGPGSKEKKLLFEEVVRVLELPVNPGSKPELARRVTELAGLRWGPECESAGNTITALGLARVLQAVRRLRRTGAYRRSEVVAAAEAVSGSNRFAEYMPATGGISSPPIELIIEWDELDRATRAHANLQNEVASMALAHGAVPISPAPEGPFFDVAWWNGEELVVCEVKSATSDNHRQQIRLGLGQVLEYRHLLQKQLSVKVTAVLVVGHRAERELIGVAAAAGVRLSDPDGLMGLIEALTSSVAPPVGRKTPNEGTAVNA